ncbi:T9SS type A sorting domain-containing protein [Candidatus Marinimicrobia bacterium]|nr:T9SS type A sorting domain-containing protein [Candidatus Neomarinimicrobiota bacterium]
MKKYIICFLLLQISYSQTNPEQVEQDTLVSAFFGLDNALPSIFCNQLGSLLDGMPVNFRFPLDSSSLSETDFEVVDSLGNIHIPMCAVLAPANENGENRTVLMLGEFGTAVTNPPVEVRVVGDLFTINTLSGESVCSAIINLNGITTTNVIPLADGPSLFFAQRIDGNLNECNSGTQTIQVAWDGGITPYISGDTESDLFQYYIGYSDSSGVLIPHIPISIADIDDNDNFHQLCFSTSDEIVKISMMANTVEDPNHDPNLYSEIDVSSCAGGEILKVLNINVPANNFTLKDNYPNPFNPLTTITYELLTDGIVNIVIYDLIGKKIKTLVSGFQTVGSKNVNWNATNNQGQPVSAGVYLYIIEAGDFRQTKKMILLK